MWKFLRLAPKPTRARSGGGSASGATQAQDSHDARDAHDSGDGLSIAWLKKKLAERSTVYAVVAIALLLTSPALTMGLTGDDYLHKLMVRDDPGIEGVPPHGLNLFTFASGDPEELRGMTHEGLTPWWASKHLRISFFRPLASLTHQLDYRLYPEAPALMHLHSLAWFAILLFAVGAVLRRFSSSPWVAGLALCLYAFDDARAAPVAWISNRNALIATAPALLALLAHDKWRKDGDRRGLWLAPLLFGLGLFGGEAAVQIGAYFLAYALFLDRGTWKQRLYSLAPYAGVVVLWRIVYRLGNYGVSGSSVYVDPASDPIHFVQTVAVRLPLLLLGQFALPYADFWELLPVIAPQLRPAMMALALLVIACTVWLLVPLLKRDPLVRFWAVGALLATIPACAAVPNDRLLTATGIGGMALVARFLAEVYERTYPRPGRAANAAAAGLIAVHALLAPLALPFRTKAVDGLEVLMRRADRSIPSGPEIEQREVVLINPPVDPFPIYFPGFREAQRIPRPHYLRWLATGVSAIEVRRIDSRTLELEPHDGYLSNSSQWVFRDRRDPFHVGDTVELTDCVVVVKSITPDGRPRAVQFRFREPLESPHLSFMQWGRHEYEPFPLPTVGAAVTVPAVDLKTALLGLGLTDS